MESTDGKFECSDFKKLKDSGVIQGTYNCDATNPDPTTSNGNSGTATGSSSSSSTTSSGAASANGVAVPVAGVAAAFYALAQLL